MTELTKYSKKLTSEGKIPHDVELEKHPEKSMEGRMWLMGDVSAMINVRHHLIIGQSVTQLTIRM
jgi:hypothetical protein